MFHLSSMISCLVQGKKNENHIRVADFGYQVIILHLDPMLKLLEKVDLTN